MKGIVITTEVKVNIRPIATGDVGLLERVFREGAAGKHRTRLRRQQQGHIVYLIAWHKEWPVGHVLIRWAGAQEYQIASRLSGCPNIADLFVLPKLRSKGIGSQILQAAEQLALERGYRQVGLSVDVENIRARALYERLGYYEAGLGEYVKRGEWIDMHGRRQVRQVICVYLVKRLIED